MHDVGLLIESVPDVETVTSVVYQPFKPAVPAVTAKAAVGPLLSSLTVNEAALVVKPASFIHEPLKTAPVVSAVWNWSVVQVTGLLIESLPDVETVTSLVYQPFKPAVPAVTAKAAEGPVLSILIVTESLAEPPALCAEQDDVVPVVSLVND